MVSTNETTGHIALLDTTVKQIREVYVQPNGTDDVSWTSRRDANSEVAAEVDAETCCCRAFAGDGFCDHDG